MSVNLPDQRAGYKLIPQLYSEDSELSEDELLSLYNDGFQIITKKHTHNANKSPEESGEMNSHVQTAEMNEESFEMKARHIFPPEEENLSMQMKIMSRERKISFILSVFLCFCTVVVFLLLPCEWDNCKCAHTKEERREIWKNVFSNIEIKGSINLVESSFGNYYNLLFMACGSIFADSPIIRSDAIPASGGDVILLNGLSGYQIWRKHYNNMPVDIDCTLIYVKRRNVKECIVIFYGNHLAIVSSEAGKVIWSIPGNNGKHSRKQHEFPVILPDLDNDDVRELVTIKNAGKLILLSGSTGTVILSNITNPNCTEMKNLKSVEWLSVTYLCTFKNNATENVTVNLQNYIKGLSAVKKYSKIPQHNLSYRLNESEINGYRILVSNEGNFCPNNCTSKVVILDEKKRTIWTHESQDSYVMKPNKFNLENEFIYGFAFKIWEHAYEDSEEKKLKIYQHNFQFTVGSVYERTVVVVLNSTLGEPLQTINMSSNLILQICNSGNAPQPDPKYQENSLFIFDVNKNGTYQLVTYYSTYEEVKKNYHSTGANQYTLKSYIQMLDLGEEIKKRLIK